ncbi:MAG: hypothetical protein ACPGVU_16145 [Limisphaerales bacterium]
MPAPAKARVVSIGHSLATENFIPQPQFIRQMVAEGIRSFGNQPNEAAAWNRLFKFTDIIGIKVFSAPGEIIGTRPAVVAAMVESMLQSGIPKERIIIWDKYYHDLRRAGFHKLEERFGIRVRSSVSAKWDSTASYENSIIGKPIWGDHEFGRKGDDVGRKSYFSNLVTKEITKHVIVSPLLNHNIGGVSGNLMSLAVGSVDNSIRFENRYAVMSEAVPEIFAQEYVIDRLALVVVDALISQYQGEEGNLLHYAKVVNQLRFSTDPVALDIMSVVELESQRKAAELPVRKTPRALFENAELLQLGVANPKRIVIEHRDIGPALPQRPR